MNLSYGAADPTSIRCNDDTVLIPSTKEKKSGPLKEGNNGKWKEWSKKTWLSNIYERRIGVFNIQPVWKFKYHIEIGQKRCLPSKTKESI